MTDASIDFETRSTVELKRTGVYPYAAHTDTDIWLMAWAIGDEEPQLWHPGEPFPDRLRAHIAAGAPLRAWNAQFERIMWRDVAAVRYGFPPVSNAQWHDTQAEALTLGLPATLADAARALGLEQQKDMRGHRLMLKMCRPRRWDDEVQRFVWWDSPENLAVLGAYCQQDVRTERAIAALVRPLTERERRVFLLDQTINDRGIAFDATLATAAKRIASREIERQNQLIAEATSGAVDRTTKVGLLKTWLTAQGLETESLNKAALRELLDDSAALSPEVRAALGARQEAAKSSLAKIDAMFSVAGADRRLRGLLKYHRAHTGRWGGALVQPQNFPRGQDVKDPVSYIPAVLRYEPLPLNVIAALLRSMLVAAPGKVLAAADFAAVEARVLAWLAGEERLLELYRRGESPYPEMGAVIFGRPKNTIVKPSDDYTVSKNTVLGAGFGMGKDRFREQLWQQTGLAVSEGLAERAIRSYRELNTRIVEYWRLANSAAMEAVRNPGEVFSIPPRDGPSVKFTVRGAYLWVVLPSRRSLAYFRPRIEDRTTSWGETKPAVTYLGYNTYTHQWGRIGTYGGMLTENIVQAVARDLLVDAMLRVEERWPVVLTVHDEVVVEMDPTDSEEEFENLMKRTEPWANGLPVDVETWKGERYRK